MDFLERLKVELKDLDDKGHKLDIFCCSDKFKELSVHEQVLLCLQAQYMENYREVLEERVRLYEKKARG